MTVIIYHQTKINLNSGNAHYQSDHKLLFPFLLITYNSKHMKYVALRKSKTWPDTVKE